MIKTKGWHKTESFFADVRNFLAELVAGGGESRDLLRSKLALIQEIRNFSKHIKDNTLTSRGSLGTLTSLARTIEGHLLYLRSILVGKATDPEIYNVTMTLANAEYDQALPADTKKFMIHTRDGTEFRLAFETGRVAVPTEPYFTVPDFEAYWEDLIEPASLTLYFGCADTLKVIEIICWS